MTDPERPPVEPHAAVQACEECGGDHWTREHLAALSERPPVDPLREALLDCVALMPAERYALLRESTLDTIENVSLRAAIASPAAPRPEGQLTETKEWSAVVDVAVSQERERAFEAGRATGTVEGWADWTNAPRPEGLDVERLARAMIGSEGVAWPVQWVREPDNFDWIARQIAAEYHGG